MRFHKNHLDQQPSGLMKSGTIVGHLSAMCGYCSIVE